MQASAFKSTASTCLQTASDQWIRTLTTDEALQSAIKFVHFNQPKINVICLLRHYVKDSFLSPAVPLLRLLLLRQKLIVVRHLLNLSLLLLMFSPEGPAFPALLWCFAVVCSGSYLELVWMLKCVSFVLVCRYHPVLLFPSSDEEADDDDMPLGINPSFCIT